MLITKKPVDVLAHAEEFLNYFNELSFRTPQNNFEMEMNEIEVQMAHNGYSEEAVNLTNVARHFKGTPEEDRLLKTVNTLLEGAERVGNLNILKEQSVRNAMHNLFPEKLLSGKYPGLDRK